YASVKGFDLTLRNRYNKYLSGTIDYTYSVAKGNNSQPRGGYFDAFAGEEPPHQEYYLDFDQRHDLAVNFNLLIPDNDGPDFGGIKPFENMNINILFQAGSGLPYTPYVDPSLRIDINSARKPFTSTLDLSIRKNVKVGGITTALFMDVTNVFNKENVVHVYSRTGKPYDTGEPHLVGASDDADHNPLHVGPPRIIKAGLQIIW
ncbi:MAG: hypothetical protein KAR38_12175, partial [Calditrichia bacterium]|nr:hypothetical protein [Calditrichia bacterium]